MVARYSVHPDAKAYTAQEAAQEAAAQRAEQEANPANPSIRVPAYGVARITINGPEPEKPRYPVGETTFHRPGLTSDPINGQLAKDSDQVQLANGMTTSVKVAIRTGMLMRAADGTLYEPGSPEAGPVTPSGTATGDRIGDGKGYDPQEARKAPEAPPHEALSDQAAEEDLGKFATHVDQLTQLSILGSILREQDIPEHALIRAGDQMGLSLDQARDRIEAIEEQLSNQWIAAVGKAGVYDLGDFVDWAKESPVRMQQVKEAMRDQVLNRSTRQYVALARTYLEDLDKRDPDALLTANYGPGVSAFKHGDEVILRLPEHGEVPWKSAVRLGLVGAPYMS